MRGRSFWLTALAVAAAAMAGCGSGPAKTPVACLGSSGAYLKALAAAPGQVRLEGSSAISSCIVPAQSAGELATAGRSIVLTATTLNAAARRNLTGPATVQLGYLVGAVQRGAGKTGGIHADLVRRLDAAARFSPHGLLPAEFERTFGTGYAAGLRDG